MKKKTWTALLSRTGMLRVPKELLPADAKEKKLYFSLVTFPVRKELVLRLSSNGTDGSPQRKAMYSNAAARSPQVCVMSALRFLQVQPTKKSMEFPIRKMRDGSLVVKF